MYSTKGYKLIELDVVSSAHPKERVTFGATVGWRDATRVGYYGLGMDTDVSDRADFRFQQAFAQATAMWRPSSWFRASAAAGFEDFSLKDPTGARQSVTDAYTPATAPGLGDSPSFLHTNLRVGLNTRTTPGYSRVGSYLGTGLVSYIDPTTLTVSTSSTWRGFSHPVAWGNLGGVVARRCRRRLTTTTSCPTS